MSLEIPKGGMAGLEGNWILGPGKEKPAGGAAGFTTKDSTGVNLIRNYVVANADPQAENDNPEWPAPVDLNGRLGAPALKKGLIPEGLESFVWDRAEALGVDPGVIAMGCIVTCAAAISNDIKIQPKEHDHTWTESARLWAAIVGNPSTKKTPGLEQAVKPARRLDMEASEDAVGPMEQFGLDVQIYKKQLQRYTSAVAKGDDSAPAPSKPTKPVCRRLVVQDTTTEALSEVLAENDRGLLVFVDELSGFFGSMDAYRGGTGLNKDRPLWLQAYNGGRATFDRIGRGQVIVPNWSTCVLGGIQPDPMRRIAKNIDDDGLLQRFMIVCARPAERDVDRPANLDAINGYRDLVRGLYAINKGAETCNYTLSKEAHTYRVKVADFAHQCLITGDVLGSPLSAHLGKWGGLFARLALTFHQIEYTAKGQRAPYVIDEGTARKVHDFMTGSSCSRRDG